MKKSNATITTALSNASQDLMKAAQALNVSVLWLLHTKGRYNL